MAYPDDVVTLYRLGKVRIAALIFAFSCTIVEILFDLPWLGWPRAAAWLAVAVIAGIEARTLKRMGRDSDGAWLRAGLGVVVAIYFAVSAARG